MQVSKTILGLALGLLLFCSSAMAWQHAVSLGYGYSQEVGYSYYNSGFLLNGKLYKFSKLDRTLIFTIDGSLGQWHARSKHHQDLTTLAISGAFRAYFVPPRKQVLIPYLLFSFGPAYLFQTHFGEQQQGSSFTFQTTLGAGSEFTISQHNFDFNLRLVHYCNAGIFKPNQGFNILLLGSIGYLF